MKEIITGEWDGEKIVRAETSFDRMEKELHDKVLDDHDCHASPEDGCECGDRVGEINGVDSDEEYENNRDNNL